MRLVDLRNHGASPWSEEMSYAAMAGDVAALIEGEDVGPATLIGHSMGGKVAMTLALTRPDLVARLIVVDIAPVRYAQGYEHFIRAMQAADLAPPRRRADVDAALASAIPEPAMRAFLLQNLETRDGALAWQPNLAVLLRAMPELTGFPATLAGGQLRRADLVPARCDLGLCRRGGRAGVAAALPAAAAGHGARCRALAACRAAGGVPETPGRGLAG